MEILKFILNHFVMLMKDQKGEANLDVDDPEPGEEPEPEEEGEQEEPDPNADPDVTLELGEEESGEEEGEEGEEEETETKGIIESLTKQVRDLEKIKDNDQTYITQLKSQINALRSDINSIKDDKGGDEAAQFTDQQLVNILTEHKDDPAMMLAVVKQAVKQATADIKPDIERDTDLAGKKKETESYLNDNWPNWKSDDSIQTDLKAAKEYLGVQDHPLSDFMAMSTMIMNQLPTIIKNAKEEGKKEALGEKADGARKRSIKANSLAKTGTKKGGKTASLSDTETETENLLNMNPQQKKIYRQMLQKSKAGTQAVEVA